MKTGNLGRFGLAFSGVMILVMAGIVTLARVNADDEPYFLLFWCACSDGVGFYRINPDGSGMARVVDAGLAPNTIQWSPRGMTLAQMKALAVRPGVYRMRWDGRAVRLLVGGRVDVVRTGWMTDGSLLVERGDGLQRQMSLTRVAAQSDETALVNAEIIGTGAQASPDGAWLAYQSFRGGYWHLYVMPFEGGDETQLTDVPYSDTLIGWSPDGERILFTRAIDSFSATLYDIRRDGSDLRQLIADRERWRPERVAHSPDGAWITYSDFSAGQYDVAILPADGGVARHLTATRDSDHSVAWSWDSKWIAYVQVQRATNRTSIYRMRPDGSDVREVITVAGNVQNPMWSAAYGAAWEPGIAVVVGVGMVGIGIGLRKR